jgi:hypothetical protein
MHSTLTNKPSDDPHDIVVAAPDAIRVAPSDDELSDLLHQAARHRSDMQSRAGSDFPAGATVAPVDTTFRPASVDDVTAPGDGWPMARRALRGLIALLLAACIGLVAVAWKSYGDAAIRQAAKLATQLVLITSLQRQEPAPAAQPVPPAVQADAANPASPQPAPPAESAAGAVAPAAVAPSPDSAPSLQSTARDLASLTQQVEQLKASQQQMSRDLAKASEAKASEVKASEAKASEAKASEQNLRSKISAPPPRRLAAPSRKPMPAYAPPQALAAPALPPAAAPYVPQASYMPRPPEPPPQTTGEALTDPELSSVPRPPMPVR